jgi:hypothetical protein
MENSIKQFAGAALVLIMLSLSISAFAKDLSLVLPDTGTYSYWIQSPAGDLAVLPKTVDNHRELLISGNIVSGDRLYVMDARTGNLAFHPIVTDPAGDPESLEFTVIDFQPIEAPYLASSNSDDEAPSGEPHKDGVFMGFGHPWSFALGVIMALPLFWLLSRLIPLALDKWKLASDAMQAAVPDSAEYTSGVVYNVEAERTIMGTERTIMGADRQQLTGQVPGAVLHRHVVPPVKMPRRPRHPYLVGIQGIVAGSIFTLADNTVMVGRGGDNGIVLAENTVSSKHARLSREADGRISVSDVGSINGVFINGMRVEYAVLRPGDELQIGENYFRFEV